ncbi:replication initiator protein A [Desulfobacterales bacterium HSG2]|nr:replication initiator protein A [Desulfobacterales bacterium HSG2]
MRSQQEGWKEELLITRYEVLENCGSGKDQRWYKRLEDSLNRWENVRIKFEGLFYNGIEYEKLHFGIIDSWGIHKDTKKLEITFNRKWLSRIKDSTYYKMLKFEAVKKLRSPFV